MARLQSMWQDLLEGMRTTSVHFRQDTWSLHVTGTRDFGIRTGLTLQDRRYVKRLAKLYCPVCTSGPRRYKGEWILFTVQFALQDHEDTKETGYYLLYIVHFRTMKIQRRLDTIYCTVCTSGPWRYKGDWILYTVQFALQDHEDTKETGYYLLYS